MAIHAQNLYKRFSLKVRRNQVRRFCVWCQFMGQPHNLMGAINAHPSIVLLGKIAIPHFYTPMVKAKLLEV